MMKKTITQLTDILYTGWHLTSLPPSMIDIPQEPFASGGYGDLYTLDGQVTASLDCTWVVKVSRKGRGAATMEGYRNIRELTAKISHYQQSNYAHYTDFLARYSPLVGFPQACFKGVLEGEEIYGYVMPNLYSLGFVLLSDLLEHEEKMTEYQEGRHNADEIERRIRCARLLADTFHLLQKEFKYLHGDVKALSVWVQEDNHLCALIDYDGGLFDLNPLQRMMTKGLGINQPKIFGQLQEWLAPEILREVNDETKEARLYVSFESDNWSFAVGAFQVITGLQPFIFIREMVYASLAEYTERFAWPVTAEDDALFHPADALAEIAAYFKFFEQYSGLWSAWRRVLGEGFYSKNARYDGGRWVEAFDPYITHRKPLVRVKSSDPCILAGQEAQIEWDGGGAGIRINGRPLKTRGAVRLPWERSPVMVAVNEFGEYPVNVPLEVVPLPAVSFCRLVKEHVGAGSAAEVEWVCEHVAEIVVSRGGITHQIKTATFEFYPVKGETIELIFWSKYRLKEERFLLSPVVIEPVRASFIANRKITAETLPVNLTWETFNADLVQISGLQVTLPLSGQQPVRPLVATEYVLTASNEFFTERRIVYIDVLPIPKIGNLNLPQPPDLRIGAPGISIRLPAVTDARNEVVRRIKHLLKKKPF